MHRFLSRITRWRPWATGRGENDPFCGGERRDGQNSASQYVPLTLLSKELESVQVAMGHVAYALEDTQRRLADIGEHLGNAWRERETLIAAYYRTLRAMLSLLDDLEPQDTPLSHGEVLCGRVERLLREEGVLPMGTSTGDPFHPEFHVCEEVARRHETPDGTIVQVLEEGYVRKLGSGVSTVVRPAKVMVNKNPDHENEEARP